MSQQYENSLFAVVVQAHPFYIIAISKASEFCVCSLMVIN